jgi:hypothetical protein
MAGNRAGWLTLHEVLEDTGLSYGRLMELVEEGRLTRERCGSAELFDPDDVAQLSRAPALD